MSTRTIERGEPVYGIENILPLQGEWSEVEYFNLIERRHVEFTDGIVEILPLPTTSHQEILLFILQLLLAVSADAVPGKVLPSGIKLCIRARKIREPDIIFVRRENVPGFVGEQFWTGADLVVEIVCPDKPERDYADKRLDYAEGRVPEYWIVDAQRQTFTVLTLAGEAYAEHGVFRPGEAATSARLAGVTVDVAACFAAGQGR